MDEREVIKRVLSGERHLFREIVNQYSRGVFSLCFRTLNDAILSEDITQETFIRAFSRLETYKPEFKFHSWLFRIATNLCYDHFRKNKRRGSHRDVSIEQMQEAGTFEAVINRYHTGESAEDTAILKMEQARIKADMRRALLNVPEKSRIILVLFYEKELSYREIAEVLEVKVNNVKIMLHRARARLCAEMEKIKPCNTVK